MGTLYDHKKISTAFKRVLKAAHLPPHFTPHCLRHSFASLLLQQGESPVYVQRQLGHASIQLTVDTYGKWLPMGNTAAVDRLDSQGADAHGSKMVANWGRGDGGESQVPEIASAPGVNRTPDLQIRSLPLYPTELRARSVLSPTFGRRLPPSPRWARRWAVRACEPSARVARAPRVAPRRPRKRRLLIQRSALSGCGAVAFEVVTTPVHRGRARGYSVPGGNRGRRKMRSITDIGPLTTLCALIGNPVAHSMSPAIHNRAFAELGLDYVYVAFRVEDVGAAVAGMRALTNFRGMSVTIPHKVSIIKHLDEVAAVDRGIGSVNTVVNDGGRLKGSGSDGPGALEALIDAGVRVAGKNVTILGSGGAARAIAFSLAAKAKPASLFLLGEVEPELKALKRDLVRKTGANATCALLEPAALEARLAESQVLIHCTPVGMHPKTSSSLVPKLLLHRDLAVMDIVYNPLETKLLADAAARGLKTISGVEMFVNQAVIQFELWTGKTAPREVMRAVVLEHLGAKSRRR